MHHFFKTPRARGGFLMRFRHSPQPGFSGVKTPGWGEPVFSGVFSLLKVKFAVKKCKITDFAAFCFAKRA